MTTKIQLFNCGELTVPLGLLVRGESMEESVRIPVPVYLVENETERILVDTGLHPGAIADPDAFYGREYAFGPFVPEQERSIADQVDLTTLTRVILTHLHWDHAGALALIPESVPVVVQRAEWTAGHDDEAIARNFYLPPAYAGREVELVDGEHDLLGDGSIRLLVTPGHTPGHQSVRVGDVVIGGDVVHFAGALDDHRFPLFGDDHSAQGRSADRLRGLRDEGLTVLPGHDPAVLRPGPVT
jgi:glyoxylase-like metal-dependent hydrolase (beta-lactamase superfamily II)